MDNIADNNNERGRIAPYGTSASETKGRKYSEKEHALRTPFQRDRDRIIHSTAFRRLEYKTQVFIYHEGDYYRNRLTHTLEVQQIARTIARTLQLNEDLAEAVSLAHDLGHTPFGHKGEDVLNVLVRKHGYEGFEHNRQGLRIVDKLEKRYPQFPGLNLSFEVREGIIKHNSSYDAPLEGPEFLEFLKDPSPTLEAQVVSIADEIAYTCHDLDDGLKSGIIDFKDLSNISLWNRVIEKISPENPDSELKRRSAVRNLINHLATDLISQSRENIKRSGVESVSDVRGTSPLIEHSEKLKREHAQLRKLLEENMYAHYRVVRMAQKAAKIITELFEAYMSEPKQLPPHTQQKIHNEPQTIVIADYIAGMTDRFAQMEYRKLFDPTSLV